MSEYARKTFELERIPDGQKSSVRKQLEQIERTTGKTPEKLLNMPELPYSLGHVWDWFLDIFRGEQITYQEIQAWANMTDTRPTPYEVRILRKLADIFREVK